ncbi:nuclear receptor coactivator 7 isoform X2 [Lepisosteus oculatus]|uniref:nuclear receptor coactivator 7 isoform X2 n=1 Tax=Lepisosteus oculatus TaxID=7918 RepID=UPI0035F506C4
MEKKERKPSYFARLKKRKQVKQNSERTADKSSEGLQPQTGQVKQDKTSISEAGLSLPSDLKKSTKENTSDEDKKKKNCQRKEIRRSDLKKNCGVDDNRNKTRTKKEKRRVIQKPSGTVEYTAGPKDTLNCIALKFNITPNRLVEINRLFSHTIVPGQTLFVPDVTQQPTETNSLSVSPCSPASAFSSDDPEFDKMSDADSARKASKPLHRILSSASEEEEPSTVKFLKMSCRYITDGKGVVGGVMIVTPNNIMFDPHKSDPLVIENGCEEYGLICPMEEVVSIALYNDISHMKIKDALPSPGEWEDLSSEQDINPFSRFKAMSKEKCLASVDEAVYVKHESETTEKSLSDEGFTEIEPLVTGNTDESLIEPLANGICTGSSDDTQIKKGTLEALVHQSSADKELVAHKEHTLYPVVSMGLEEREDPELEKVGSNQNAQETPVYIHTEIPKGKALKEGKLPDDGRGGETAHATAEPSYVDSAESETPNDTCLVTSVQETTMDQNRMLSSCERAEVSAKKNQPGPDQSTDALNGDGPLSVPQSEEVEQQNRESEIKSWLFKRIQGPIEDMLPSKEEKSKKPPMFLCIKVGRPMRKTFACQSASPAHQYGRRGKQPEYWFAVPQERSNSKYGSAAQSVYGVDHLYAFFVQWSPDIYGNDAKEQGFIVVEKDELDMIDNFFGDPVPKSWEIITVNEAKRRQSYCSYEDEDEEDLLPALNDQSVLLEDTHIEKLAQCLPARTQGYPWRLVYSTAVHGTSLKTLYRNLAHLDSPVLLVIKDVDNQVFGALTSHPLKVSDHCYGTGETFLYTFSPEFKIFRWSGENSYFIKGDTDSVELGGGGGHFGLWLDADLYHGSSYPCYTFQNETLSKKEDFIVQDLEVWTFE